MNNQSSTEGFLDKPSSIWFIALLLLIGICCTASGQGLIDGRWQYFGTASDEPVYIDTKTFKPGKTNHIFWTRQDKQPCVRNSSYKDCSLKQQVSVICKTRQIAVIRMILNNQHGNVVTDTGVVKASFEDPVPGSLGEGTIDYVCGT